MSQIYSPLPAWPIIETLHRLCNQVGKPTPAGRQARIEFVQLAYWHGLVGDIESYALWDAGYEGLGPRALDTCFEMDDGEAVAEAVIQHARESGYAEAIREHVGAETFARWEALADRQGCLAL